MEQVIYPPSLSMSAATIESGPSLSHVITLVSGRINFGVEIPKRSHVFFQGSSKVGRVIRDACGGNKSIFQKGTGGKEVDDVTRKPPTVMKNPIANCGSMKTNSPPTIVECPVAATTDIRFEDIALNLIK